MLTRLFFGYEDYWQAVNLAKLARLGAMRSHIVFPKGGTP